MSEEDKKPPFVDLLIGVPKAQYGPSYAEHVLEIYRTYVEMADRISSRRVNTNSFFLTLNTAVVGFIGYLAGTDKLASNDPWLSLVAISGIVLSYLWYRIIRSYRGLNSGKFKVIHEIENLLPLRPYDAEWECVGRGKNPKLYLPFTHVEVAVPWVFVTLHFFVVLRIFPWSKLYIYCGGNA